MLTRGEQWVTTMGHNDGSHKCETHQRVLHGGVAAADDHDRLAGEEEAVARCTRGDASTLGYVRGVVCRGVACKGALFARFLLTTRLFATCFLRRFFVLATAIVCFFALSSSSPGTPSQRESAPVEMTTVCAVKAERLVVITNGRRERSTEVTISSY